MFWLVIIAIIAGTYYFVKWGKKKSEQQGQEEAEQERRAQMQERPNQPPKAIPFPYEPKHFATTAQLVGYIGRWTEAEAINIMGQPTGQQPLNYGDGIPHHINSQAYVDWSPQRRKVDLSFNDQNHLLETVSLYPEGARADLVQQALGSDFVENATPGVPGKTINFTKLRVVLVVDGGGMVQQMIFGEGADPAVLFAPTVAWPAGIPWLSGKLVKAPPLPTFPN